ncbi:MAG: hypothetical protein MI746_18035 [Pseudomonadales bacterium]|nr:hypothetical protein [Pseudomonadales bacterium]
MTRLRITTLLIGSLVALSSFQVSAQSEEALIQAATQSLPEHLRADVTVLDRSTNPPTLLRQGTNGITCMTDEPAPGYDASCVDESWFPYGRRLGELRADGKSLLEANKIVNTELANGSLASPNPGALANTVSGPDANNLAVLTTIFLGEAASAMSGIVSEENDQAWIMCAGTPQAHLMIGPVRYQLRDVDLKHQCGTE